MRWRIRPLFLAEWPYPKIGKVSDILRRLYFGHFGGYLSGFGHPYFLVLIWEDGFTPLGSGIFPANPLLLYDHLEATSSNNNHRCLSNVVPLIFRIRISANAVRVRAFQKGLHRTSPHSLGPRQHRFDPPVPVTGSGGCVHSIISRIREASSCRVCPEPRRFPLKTQRFPATQEMPWPPRGCRVDVAGSC